jgi:hypothetical protein
VIEIWILAVSSDRKAHGHPRPNHATRYIDGVVYLRPLERSRDIQKQLLQAAAIPLSRQPILGCAKKELDSTQISATTPAENPYAVNHHLLPLNTSKRCVKNREIF